MDALFGAIKFFDNSHAKNMAQSCTMYGCFLLINHTGQIYYTSCIMDVKIIPSSAYTLANSITIRGHSQMTSAERGVTQILMQ